uniref:Uncharacterized protein n=1 Tax=Anopheles epiroticus TaxID=199890 RepID=A0A240PL01_9DIPT
MTGNTGNAIELLVQQIEKGHHFSNRIPVRKIYIDEDPNKEQPIPCPRCLERNRQSMVRYLFLNLSEAIFKCEAADCMYPFRNFKFKNFEESTVYRYQLNSQNEFDTNFASNFSTECYSYYSSIDHVASVDFNLDFLSSDGATELQPQKALAAEPSSKAQPPPAAHENLSTCFDTRFIDDILQDLFPSTTNPMPKTCNETKTACSSTEITTIDLPPKADSVFTQPCGRKLEKCLKVFEKTSNRNEDDVFKKPRAPAESNSLVVEPISPTKLRIKKIGGSGTKMKSPTSKGNKLKKSNDNALLPGVASVGGLELKQARALVKNKKIKPLEFVSSLNTLLQDKNTNKPMVERQPLVRQSPNCAKVQKMLNFIQRSMKTSEEKESPVAVATPVSDNVGSCNSDYSNFNAPDPCTASHESVITENYLVINGSMQLIDNDVDDKHTYHRLHVPE